MDVETEIRLCRACGKKNFVFCSIQNEVIHKLLKFIPSLLDIGDKTLPVDVCITCYPMMKTLVFNIESIRDMQKILRMQSGSRPEIQLTPVVIDNKRTLAEDITKKYTNIKLRKISPEKTSTKLINPFSAPKVSKTIVIDEVQEKPKHLPEASSSQRSDIQRSFMCISCSEKFQKFTHLEAHLKSCRSTSTQQFKCFCGKVLASKKELSSHVSVQHKQNKQQHICTICKKVFTSLSNLQNHVMMHKSPLKGIYMCHVCSCKFPDLQGLKDHRTSCKRKSSEA